MVSTLKPDLHDTVFMLSAAHQLILSTVLNINCVKPPDAATASTQWGGGAPLSYQTLLRKVALLYPGISSTSARGMFVLIIDTSFDTIVKVIKLPFCNLYAYIVRDATHVNYQVQTLEFLR